MNDTTRADVPAGSPAPQGSAVPPGGPATGPGRFAAPAPVQARRSAREIIGAACVLLLLLVGLPVGLLVLGAPPPVPTGLPSEDDLTQPLSTGALLTLLVAIVWLAWLFFLVCVAVELVAALRGGLARPVPFGGPVQKLARALVGALLISGVIAGPAGAAPAAEEPVRDGSVAAASVQPETATDASTGARTGGWAVGEEQTPTLDPGSPAADDLVGKKVYTVKPPRNGYHDNLWDIAERHLGDGRRYKEIYQLNDGRTQPDGRSLELARLIQPGWELVMPEDAVGVPRVKAPAGDVVPGSSGGAGAGAAGAAGGAAAAADGSGDGAGDGAGLDEAGPVGSVSRAAAATGTGLLAAGIVGSLLLHRRRRLGREADAAAAEAEVGLRVTATPERAAWLDDALRSLATRCLEENVALPSIYAAIVDDDTVELLLAPARPDTCTPWEAVDEGRRWRRSRSAAGDPRPAGGVSPYPALVSLGVDDTGRDVLVDLEAAGGTVAIGGAGHVAGEVAAAIAVQMATSAWSDAVQVTASHLPAGIDQVGDDRIRVVDDLTTVLPELESSIGDLRQDVLTGRMARRGWVPSRLVVCGAAPDPAVADRLAALTGAARQAFAVVIAGTSKVARWQLRVDESGVLSVPALGLTVVANRISPAEVDAVAELFAATRETPHDPDGRRVPIPAPARTADDATWTTAPRRVGVLGSIAVVGAGQIEEHRRELATELVAFLAMHPDGVHPNVLAGAVWPRGVTADVRDATVERVRDWLGNDPDGHPYLRTDAEGRLALGPDVVLDWDAARSLLLRSRRATSPGEERDLLRRALHLVRGEVFADRPSDRYAWLARGSVERTMRAVVSDAAQRLATICRGDHDPDGAAEAASAGLRLDPTNLALWRDLLRARFDKDRAAGVQATLDAMGAQLDRYDVRLDAETEALVEELLPGPRSLPSSG